MKASLLTKAGFALIVLAVLVSSCRRDEVYTPALSAEVYDSEVVYEWNELYLEIDRFSPGYRPPAAARMLGYTGIALYEAIVPGMPNNRSLRHQFSGLTIPDVEQDAEYHWPTVANSVYATIFRHWYPHIDQRHKEEIDRLERLYNEEFRARVNSDVFNRSQLRGRDVANAVYDWSSTDEAGHNAYLNPRPTSYVPPEGPGLWQPTFPDFTLGLFPYWGDVRPFAIRPGDMLARPPIPYSEDPNSEFYLQSKENEIIVNENDYERLWIAEFWSDDIFGQTFQPAARWIAIANQAVHHENISLGAAAELYAKLGIAMADAAIIIWNSKYHYNVERPVSYIRRMMDDSWITALNNTLNGVKGISPEFPAYPSGHAGFGASAAAVLINVFGYNYHMTDKCHEFRTEFLGTPRSFNSFADMAYENAISRLYLGVHYRMDAEEGLRMGYLAGERALGMPWKR